VYPALPRWANYLRACGAGFQWEQSQLRPNEIQLYAYFENLAAGCRVPHTFVTFECVGPKEFLNPARWVRLTDPTHSNVRNEWGTRPISFAPVAPLRFPASGDRFTRFLIGRLSPLGFALVPMLFASCQSQLYFHAAIAEVQPRRDQGQSLLLRLADQFV
jgi:hypothetical protein